MFCKNCGARLNADSKFCLNCGTKVEIAASPAPVTSSAPLPTAAPKKSGFKPYVLIIIILSVLLAFEAGFIVYDKVFAADAYSESDEDDKSAKKNNSSSPALGDGSSLPSSSEEGNPNSGASSETEISSDEEQSNGFDATDICGVWQLVSVEDISGNNLPQVFTFYSFKFYPDSTADVVYINGNGSRDEYFIDWSYNFCNSSGIHYYELADNKGNTYSLAFMPENNELLMEYELENGDLEFHYYQRVN